MPQQLVLLQTEFGKTYGTQHQRAPVTLVHVLEGGEENEEELRRRAASGENGPPVAGAAMKGFWLVLFLILLCLQGMQV